MMNKDKKVMPMQRYKPEQVVTMLPQVEVQLANGKTAPEVGAASSGSDFVFIDSTVRKPFSGATDRIT